MKTSNKLLLGFLLIVIASPFMLLMGFKKVIKENKFTVVDYQFGILQERKLGAYKIVKIEAGAITTFSDIFKCSLIPSNVAKYEIPESFNSKSLSVRNVGDTLIIRYDLQHYENGLANIKTTGELNMKLFLPDMSDISISGVTAIIDSVDASKNNNMKINLRNQAKLEFGKPDYEFTTLNNYYGKPYNTIGNLFNSGYIVPKINSLNIIARDSRLTLGNNIEVENLQIGASFSKISVQPGCKINVISGEIDSETILNGSSGSLQKLLPLIKK